jgi:SAM-dependent methyltransferase
VIGNVAEFWNGRAMANGANGAFYHLRARRVADAVSVHAPGPRALDVGCGTGLLVRELAMRGFDIHGIDIAPNMIAAARVRCAGAMDEPERRLRVCSMDDLGSEPRFDVVTAIGVLPYVADRRGFISALSALCRPDGLVAVSIVNHPSAFAAQQWLYHLRWAGSEQGRAVLWNLASRGLWSGGATPIPLRRPGALRAEMAEAGFTYAGDLCFFNIGVLDSAPAALANALRALAWTYVGLFYAGTRPRERSRNEA